MGKMLVKIRSNFSVYSKHLLHDYITSDDVATSFNNF